MSLSLRPARVEESALAAKLLAETMGEFGVEVLGLGRPELQLKALKCWFAEKGNRFSYELSTVAEKDGKMAGLLLAFPGGRIHALTLGCAKRIFQIYTIAGAFRMMWRNQSLANNREAEKDEYLIAHLAVDENFRRQGVGQALLEKAGEDARALGLGKLALEVEMDNNKAIALYQKAGFKTADSIYYAHGQGRFKSPGFHKMLKSN